jgi:hypothetical protein
MIGLYKKQGNKSQQNWNALTANTTYSAPGGPLTKEQQAAYGLSILQGTNYNP